MKENKRRSIVLVIIAIASLALIVGAATFAFFATGRDLDNGVINANVGTAASMYSFSATSNGNIEMNIAFNEMSEANVNTTFLKTDNATINVSLASPSEGMKTTCTYDIVWVWDSTGDNIYTSPDMSIPDTINNKTYNYEFSAKVDEEDEKDLSKYSTNGSIVTLQKDVTIESTSTTANEIQHRIDAYIYNLPVDQQKLFDKQFRAHITIDNLNCNMEDGSASTGISLAKYITEELYTEDGVNDIYLHDGEGTYGDLEAGDNSYRYAGADPKNYICFEEDANEDGTCANDNLYRIIGVIDGKAKLIKHTNINTDNTLVWNAEPDNYDWSYDINNWEGSSLETYLNNDQEGGFLHKLGTRASLIEETTWSVGGFDSSNLSSQNAKGIYELEINPTSKTTYPAKIGLMYVSEYMYAAEPTYWNYVAGNNTTNGYNLSKGNDWMLSTDYPWTISRRSDSSNVALGVTSSGGVSYHNYVFTDYNAVRPSFSLSSYATITIPTGAGAGSINKPYIITGKLAS